MATSEAVKSNARLLRKAMTDAERRLWNELRLRQVEGLKFRRQFPIGRYIVDFACPERKLIIEVDGGQHADQESYDTERTRWLESRGFRVLRFWNNEIQMNLEGVKESIYNALVERGTPPTPALPHKGGGRLNLSSPLMGEDVDGGDKGQFLPPTSILPHKGGRRTNV
jgi:very-short-patch-repair endonuclease